ncbi:hypothetical protein [Sphaerothrix gracilis]|uniref:hypothetical protein n=1 Tax=Sphaerothrix gracilis TaxID=3151835 RepID=UPI0031FD0B1C
MKDAEAQILKAFLYALWRQTEALPETVLHQMQAISDSLDTRVVELHDLATAVPVLELPYKTAYRWLTASAAERGLGLDFLPPEPDDSGVPGETPNIVRDVRPHIEEMRSVLALIDQKLEQAPKILKSSSPSSTAQQELR